MKTFEVKRVSIWDGAERHNFGFYVDAGVPDGEIQNHSRNSSIDRIILTVFDSIEEVKANDHKSLMKRAWGKLTAQERAAVGLPIMEPK